MARTRDDYHLAVQTLLGDLDGVRYSEALLDDALGQALHALSLASPLAIEATFPVPESGQELSLADLAPVNAVIEVWYPFSEDDFWLEPLGGWHFLRLSGSPVIRWKNGTFRQAEMVRVLAVCDHQVAGLNGAEASTPPPHTEETLKLGMAAYSVLARSAQLLERHGALTSDQKGLLDLGEKWLARFERQCVHLRASPFSPYGALPKQGWTLGNADGWQ